MASPLTTFDRRLLIHPAVIQTLSCWKKLFQKLLVQPWRVEELWGSFGHCAGAALAEALAEPEVFG